MNAADLGTLAQLFTERLLNSVAAGVVLAGLVGVLLRLIGRQSSETRFAIWFSTLVAVVALPFHAGSAPGPSQVGAVPVGNSHGQIVLAASWASYLFTAWGVGTALLLLRVGVGLWRVRALHRNSIELDVATLDPAIAEVFRTLLSGCHVKLCASKEVAVPAAVGLCRPAIVFPARLLPCLSGREIEMIVRHELAHLRRLDDWTNLAQKIVKAVFFFHPAVWWIENRLTLEREMACDEMVLAQTGSPRAYASSLISFAEKLQTARSLALAQTLISRMHQMSLRLAQILDAKRPSRTGLWKPALALSTGLLALAFHASPQLPQLVSFRTRPSARPVYAPQQVASAVGEPEVEKAAVGRSVAGPVALRQDFVPRPKVVPVKFHRRRAAGERHFRAASPPTLAIVSLDSAQPEPFVRATFAILQTTVNTPCGISRSAVWTLSIWRVNREPMAEERLQSTIVVSWI
jgi:bla regulator protein blaR1